MGECKKVCKKCNCTEWVGTGLDIKCKNCDNAYCSAHKWFLYCEDNEIKNKDGLEFFVGNFDEHGVVK